MMRPSASGKQRDWTHHESAVGANRTSCDVRFSVVIGGKADLLGWGGIDAITLRRHRSYGAFVHRLLARKDWSGFGSRLPVR